MILTSRGDWNKPKGTDKILVSHEKVQSTEYRSSIMERKMTRFYQSFVIILHRKEKELSREVLENSVGFLVPDTTPMKSWGSTRNNRFLVVYLNPESKHKNYYLLLEIFIKNLFYFRQFG